MCLTIRLKFKRIFFFTVTLLFLEVLFLAPQNVFCQNTGFKYITNYSRKDYGLLPQNWCILQDNRGVVYVGNQGGLLEFDGVSWREINIPNRTVRSMSMDDAGTIYIGGYNEFGYLVPDEKGSLQYVSLSANLKDNQKDFFTVWKTYRTKEGIYFQANQILFRWNSKKIKSWPTDLDTRFHFSYVCKGDFFIKQDKKGLMKMVNDELELIPGGEIFANKRIYMMVPYDSKKLLIGTRENGFYIYDGIKAVKFPTEMDGYLKERQLYHGIRLSSSSTEPGDFALATLQGGLIIIDSRGRLKKIFTNAHGLGDNDVKYVYEDFQGNLWLALGDGVSKIEYTSPVSIFDKRSDLHGRVLSVVKHHNKLYVGTTYGLNYLVPPDSFESPVKFRPIPNIFGSCRSMVSIDDCLFAATSRGVFQIETKSNLKIQQIIKSRSYFLLRSQTNANRIWVGTDSGVVSLYQRNGQWKKEFKFKEITQLINTIVEDIKGDLWLGTRNGVIKVDFLIAGIITAYYVKRYQTSHGLPAGGVIDVFWAAGHTMFATRKGIYRFDEEAKVFIPDSTLGKKFAGGFDGINPCQIVEDSKKNVWLLSSGSLFQAMPRPDGTFALNEKIPPRFSYSRGSLGLYPAPDGDTIWFGRVDGLIRYDTTIKKNYQHDFQTIIRKVLANGDLVFGGYKINVDSDSNSKHSFHRIDPGDRNLRFEFAAPSFETENKTQYRYRLEGFDDRWSKWTSEAKKEYTNLDPGLYTFRVRAKNIYDDISSDAVFRFKILPPWYRTWWAYLLFAAAIFLLTFFIVKWRRSIQLEKEKQKLEQIIEDRKKEIEKSSYEIKVKNYQLEKQNFQLKEQAEKLQEMDKVKSRFFANISHEFRTPLTLIMGPLEQMLSADHEDEKERKKKLSLMFRNSQRLLSLINQLLELSKFDSGKIKLQASHQNIVSFLKGITASFEPVATKNELDLTSHAEEENITLHFDSQKLEQAFCNILSNAVKFTPPGGKITVKIKRNGIEDQYFASGSVDISVCDTGPGIPRDQLAHIFDRFYQSENTYENNHKGSGIGLAIAKEVIELHHGKIDVHSSDGENSGTEFIIRLPMEPGVPADYKEGCRTARPVVPLDIETETAENDENDAHGIEKDIDPLKQGKNIILVVEDSADVREYIRGSLEPLYTVVEAKDGREGIQKAREIFPDLIISDIMMPETDGYELCRVLKKEIDTSHIPIILLTAKASEESIIEGLETGADDYITKPFNTKILCTRIKTLIDLRRQWQQKIQRQMMLQPAEISVSSIDQTFIKELQDTIETNLSNPLFSVEQLGKQLYMSRASLYRKVFALTGESPRDFIKSYRLKRGAQLLKANFGNVTEVAFEVGFSSTAYFTKCFKEKFHQLPHTYQASH